jgi:hypothetical protein
LYDQEVIGKQTESSLNLYNYRAAELAEDIKTGWQL